MSLLDMIQQQLGPDTVRQISRQVGVDQGSTAKVIDSGLPILVSALAKNSQSSGGAASLLGALDRDHDGSVLDDLAGFLGGGGAASMGEGILGHVLGGRQSNVQSALGKSAGIDGQKVGQILAMLAPIVLGALSRQRQQKGLDAGGLGELLAGERQRVERAQPKAGGILGQLLDADGDGEIGDDVARIGVGMLGNLLGGKR